MSKNMKIKNIEIPHKLSNGNCSYEAIGLYLEIILLYPNEVDLYKLLRKECGLTKLKRIILELQNADIITINDKSILIKSIKTDNFSISVQRRTDKYPEWFDTIWKAYPLRYGSNSKCAAYKQAKMRKAEGYTLQEMLDGTRIYYRHLENKNSIATEFVMQASRFFSKSKFFLAENHCFDIPENPNKKKDKSELAHDYETFLKNTFCELYKKEGQEDVPF